MNWSLVHDRPADEPPPLLHDRYTVGSPIGRGRATVYRGTDTRLGRTVALKRVALASDHESGERVHRRALREARAAAGLDHPSVVTVYDVVEEDDALWLVMELVEAPSLAQLVAEEGALDHARAARMGLAVLGALVAAHRAGVVHRDVKPANVLVPPTGPAKLADFGVASVRDETRVTATGLVLGSPAYMAPEQARGEEVGPAADLWSLGATLYFAYEGEPPFDGGTALATASAVVHGEPRAEHRPGPLSTLVARLLTKPAADRPAADEVRAELRRTARPETATVPAPEADPAPLVTTAKAPTTAIRPAPSPGAISAPEPTPPEPTPATEAVDAGGPTEAAADDATSASEAVDASGPTEATPSSSRDIANDEPPPTRAEDAVPVPTRAQPAASATALQPAPGDLSSHGGPRPDRDRVARWVRSRRESLTAQRWGSRLVWVAVVVAMIVAALVALAFDPDDLLPDRETGPSGDGAGQVEDQRADTDTTTPTTAAASTGEDEVEDGDASTTTAASEPSGGGAGEVPEGWRTYTDPAAGYTVAHPAGWQVEPAGGSRTDFRDPETGSYLRVDWTDQPKADPVADWRTQAQGFAASHEGYEEIAIAPYDYRDYEAARWEFRYTDGGARLHAFDLNLIAGDRAYALFFQTKEENWAASQDLFAQLRESFRPPGG